MAHGTCELLWLKILLGKLGFKIKNPTVFLCDNVTRELLWLKILPGKFSFKIPSPPFLPCDNVTIVHIASKPSVCISNILKLIFISFMKK